MMIYVPQTVRSRRLSSRIVYRIIAALLLEVLRQMFGEVFTR